MMIETAVAESNHPIEVSCDRQSGGQIHRQIPGIRCDAVCDIPAETQNERRDGFGAFILFESEHRCIVLQPPQQVLVSLGEKIFGPEPVTPIPALRTQGLAREE